MSNILLFLIAILLISLMCDYASEMINSEKPVVRFLGFLLVILIAISIIFFIYEIFF